MEAKPDCPKCHASTVYRSGKILGKQRWNGRKRRQPGYGAHKRGINSKIHLAVDAHGMPVRMAVTSGTVADCTKACSLIEGIDAEYLLADKDYDSDAFVEKVEENGSTALIPPR